MVDCSGPLTRINPYSVYRRTDYTPGTPTKTVEERAEDLDQNGRAPCQFMKGFVFPPVQSEPGFPRLRQAKEGSILRRRDPKERL